MTLDAAAAAAALWVKMPLMHRQQLLLVDQYADSHAPISWRLWRHADAPERHNYSGSHKATRRTNCRRGALISRHAVQANWRRNPSTPARDLSLPSLCLRPQPPFISCRLFLHRFHTGVNCWGASLCSPVQVVYEHRWMLSSVARYLSILPSVSLPFHCRSRYIFTLCHTGLTHHF